MSLYVGCYWVVLHPHTNYLVTDVTRVNQHGVSSQFKMLDPQFEADKCTVTHTHESTSKTPTRIVPLGQTNFVHESQARMVLPPNPTTELPTVGSR